MDSKIIEIKGLEKKYNSKFSLSVDDLYLKNNKILTIIGPNGSGKSTLIRLLNLLEKPDRGAISFEGKNILDERADKFAIRKKMAVVFQEPLLFNTSVYSNIIIGLKNLNCFFEISDYSGQGKRLRFNLGVTEALCSQQLKSSEDRWGRNNSNVRF